MKMLIPKKSGIAFSELSNSFEQEQHISSYMAIPDSADNTCLNATVTSILPSTLSNSRKGYACVWPTFALHYGSPFASAWRQEVQYG